MLVFVVLFTFGSCCLAEDIDISSLTKEQLIELRDKVEFALFGCSLSDGIDIPLGNNIGGVDIPVGTYVLTSEKSDKEYLIIFASYKSETEKDKYVDRINFTEAGETVKITVTDGMLLSFGKIVAGGSVQLKSFSGLFN